MISTNYVVGTFKITQETEIPVPNGEKIIFSVDSYGAEISMNDSSEYVLYKNSDGIVEFVFKDINVYKLFVKPVTDSNVPSILRIWAYI
jgi:hypothetical protein